MTTTLYLRSDTQTVNTVNAYSIDEENTTSGVYFSTGNVNYLFQGFHGEGYYIVTTVYIVHADGSTTTLGSTVFSSSRNGTGSILEGIQTGNWSCPLTSLARTDAIQMNLYCRAELVTTSGTFTSEATRSFISGQLGWDKLKASTWTFSVYTYLDHNGYFFMNPGYYVNNVLARIYHGDSTYNTNVSGIQYDITDASFAQVV